MNGDVHLYEIYANKCSVFDPDHHDLQPYAVEIVEESRRLSLISYTEYRGGPPPVFNPSFTHGFGSGGLVGISTAQSPKEAATYRKHLYVMTPKSLLLQIHLLYCFYKFVRRRKTWISRIKDHINISLSARLSNNSWISFVSTFSYTLTYLTVESAEDSR